MNHRVLAALSLLLGGCSFVFGGGPPAEHQQMPYFDCPSTFGLPVADGVFAVSGAAAAAMTLSQSEAEFKEKNKNGNRSAAAGANIGVAAVFAASAVYGIIQTNRCLTAKEQLKARIMEPILNPPARPAPPALPPPPPLPAPAPVPVPEQPAPPTTPPPG